MGLLSAYKEVVRSATEANKYSQEQLRLMKGQDIKYISLKSQAEAKVTCTLYCSSCITLLVALPHYHTVSALHRHSRVFATAKGIWLLRKCPQGALSRVGCFQTSAVSEEMFDWAPAAAESREDAEITTLHRSTSAEQAHSIS